ncbi:MAG: hypothetical protein Q4A82_08065 [Corynebacterium sp.]|nr:hypothetical protein [Corynebacterium sp.]
MTVQTFSWVDNTLFDAKRQPLAVVESGSLQVGTDSYRITKSGPQGAMGFLLQVETEAGEVWELRKTTFTTDQLEATCGNRRYVLKKLRPWARTRAITVRGGTKIGDLSWRFTGDVKVSLITDAPLAHVAFLTYGCQLVDANSRNIKI